MLEGLNQEFCLERVIDDFVLMCYLIGNDFLPHLPGFDIATGGLNFMLDSYKELLPKWGDYLTMLGEVDLARLSQFLSKLAGLEQQLFRDEAEARGHSLEEDDDDEFAAYADGDEEESEDADVQNRGNTEDTGANNGAKLTKEEIFTNDYKESYYARKFGLSKDDVEGHANLRQRCVCVCIYIYSYMYMCVYV